MALVQGLCNLARDSIGLLADPRIRTRPTRSLAPPNRAAASPTTSRSRGAGETDLIGRQIEGEKVECEDEPFGLWRF